MAHDTTNVQALFCCQHADFTGVLSRHTFVRHCHYHVVVVADGLPDGFIDDPIENNANLSMGQGFYRDAVKGYTILVAEQELLAGTIAAERFGERLDAYRV